MKVTYRTTNGNVITVTEKDVDMLASQGGNFQLTMLEKRSFLEKCRNERANPFIGEIFISKKIADKPATIGTTQELLLKRARENPAFKGIKDGVYVLNSMGQYEKRDSITVWPNETIVGGWCEVKVEGLEPVFEAVPLAYYFAGKGKDSPDQNVWDKMPGTMIRKVARVAALRVAFPDSCYSYIQEEMPEEFSESDSESMIPESENADYSTESEGIVEEAIEQEEDTETDQIDQNTVLYKEPDMTTTDVAGVAGNPESIPEEPEPIHMTLDDAKKHIGEYGPLTGQVFGSVFAKPNEKDLLNIYATSMTGADQEAAKVLLESTK